MAVTIENPILNSPFDAPTRHFRLYSTSSRPFAPQLRRPSKMTETRPVPDGTLGFQQKNPSSLSCVRRRFRERVGAHGTTTSAND
jgi:hypothetical protein